MRSGLIFHDMEQNSPEWYKVRLGKLTSSRIHSLLTNSKPGELSRGAQSLVYQLASEIVTSPIQTDWDNYATLRGKQLEPIALAEYSERTWTMIKEVGFIQYGDYAGCSPDSVEVENTKGVETKCLLGPAHFDVIANGYDKKHWQQCQWDLFITGFEQWDLVYFHPDAGEKDMIIFPIEPDKEAHEIFQEQYEIIVNEVKRLVNLCAPKVAA